MVVKFFFTLENKARVILASYLGLIGQCAFSHLSPVILPSTTTRDTPSISIFKRCIKSFYFNSLVSSPSRLLRPSDYSFLWLIVLHIINLCTYFVQTSCILPRWVVYQQVARMSKRIPPNIHHYRTKAFRFRQSQEKRMGWTRPLLEREEERKQKALENTDKETEPHMLHVVYLLQKLKGRPWWEKKIADKLQLEEVYSFSFCCFFRL